MLLCNINHMHIGLRSPHLQALAALLVCEAADDCHGALRVVEQWVPAGDRCLLHLDARHLGADKGALQVRSAVHCLDAVACAGFRVWLPAAPGRWAPWVGQSWASSGAACCRLCSQLGAAIDELCPRTINASSACAVLCSPHGAEGMQHLPLTRHELPPAPMPLQEQLASFLSTAPSGLVVLRRIDQVCLRCLVQSRLARQPLCPCAACMLNMQHC